MSQRAGVPALPARPARTALIRPVLLPDGRKLSFAEVGSPSGYPLFYFHGFPSSRLEIRGFEEIARRLNIRVVAPDSPGYGLPTFQPNRRITDWPADIQFLANQLGFKRFTVLGGSGGGPYALACAHTLSDDKLSTTGLMASAAPWEAGTKDVRLDSHLGPPRTAPCSCNVGKKFLDVVIAKAAATVEERRNRALRIAFEGFAQGSRGFVQEAYLLTHPYGFLLEDVESKIKIWQGIKDKNSPIRMVRYMTERLPDCDLHEFDGEDHWTLMKHLEDIVTELIPVDEIGSYDVGDNAPS